MILGWKGYFYNIFVYLNLYFLKEQVYKNASTHFFCKKYCVIFLLGVKYACLTMTCVRMNKNSTHKEVFFSSKPSWKKTILKIESHSCQMTCKFALFTVNKKRRKNFAAIKLTDSKALDKVQRRKYYVFVLATILATLMLQSVSRI